VIKPIVNYADVFPAMRTLGALLEECEWVDDAMRCMAKSECADELGVPLSVLPLHRWSDA